MGRSRVITCLSIRTCTTTLQLISLLVPSPDCIHLGAKIATTTATTSLPHNQLARALSAYNEFGFGPAHNADNPPRARQEQVAANCSGLRAAECGQRRRQPLEDVPQILAAPQHQVLEPGEPLSLKCEATGLTLPQISWYLDGQLLNEQQPGQAERHLQSEGMQVAQVGRLRIGDYVSLSSQQVVHSFVNSSQVQVSEAGAYKCQANNGLHLVEREARVDVRGLPTISRQLANLSGLAGQPEPLRIQCPYGGYPIAAVEWYFKPSEPSEQQQQQEQVEPDVYALARLADEGRAARRARAQPLAARPPDEHQPEPPDPDQDEWLAQASAMTPPASLPDDYQAPDYQPGGLYAAYDSQDYEALEMDFQQQPAAREAAPPRPRRQAEGRPGWIKYPQSRRHQTHANGTLLIHELSRADQGFYRCRVLAPSPVQRLQRAEQVAEMVEANSNEFHLQVLVAPVISPFASSESLREGLRNFLTCAVIEGDPPIRLSWLKDGRPIGEHMGKAAGQSGEPARIRVEASNEYTSTLYFSHVDFKDNGNYTCIASNKAASVNYTARMLVNVPPKWLRPPKDLDCVAGQSVLVDCQAQAHPSARVWWEIGVYSAPTEPHPPPQQQQQPQPQLPAANIQSYAPNHYRTIISNSRVHILENASLVIRDVSKLDQGYYLCQAANNFGSLSALIKLTVNVGASFAPATRHQVRYAKVDERVELDCDPLGQPPVELVWFVRPLTANASATPRQSEPGRRLFAGTISSGELASAGQPLSSKALGAQQLEQAPGEPLAFELLQRHPPDGPPTELVRLVIPRARPAHSADYICQASNRFGSDARLIKLLVQEPPEPVQELSVVQLESRALALTWKAPFNGHSPITGYTIEWAPVPSGQQAGNASRWAQLSSQQPAASIQQLQPLTSYQVRVRAHNQLGVSGEPPLGPLLVSTGEEAPGAPPSDVRALALSSSAIQLTWAQPQGKSSIKGYYLGYKPSNSNESFIFKTVSLPSTEQQQQQQVPQVLQAQTDTAAAQNRTGPRLRVLIGELRRSTRYSLIVQAFNSAGPGPQSDQLEAKTLASDPPAEPTLRVGLATYASVELLWSFQQDGRQQLEAEPTTVDGYHLYYRSSEGQWQERRLSAETHSMVALGHQRQELSIVEVAPAANSSAGWLPTGGPRAAKSFRFVLDQLACGNSYQLYLVAYNAIGSGQPSQIVRAKTRGSAPIAPRRQDFIAANSSQAQLNLDAWMDAGCPIVNFEIRYRQLPAAKAAQQASDQWLLHSNNLAPELRSVELRDLQPESWYALLASAESAAGKTEVQYSFMTLDRQGHLPLEALEALEANDRLQTGGLPALFKSGNNSLRSMLFNLSAGGSPATGGWSPLLLAGSLCLILFATCSLFLIRRYNNLMLSGAGSTKDSRSLDSQTSRSLAATARHHLLADGHLYASEGESHLVQTTSNQEQQQYANYANQMKGSPCKTSSTSTTNTSAASQAFLVARCPDASQCQADQLGCYASQLQSAAYECAAATCGQQPETAKAAALERFKTIGPHQSRPVSSFVANQQLYANSMGRPLFHCNSHLPAADAETATCLEQQQQQQQQELYSKLSAAYNSAAYASYEQKAAEQMYEADAIGLALLAQQSQNLKRRPSNRQQPSYLAEEPAPSECEPAEQQVQIAVDSDGYGRYQPSGLHQPSPMQQQPLASYSPYGLASGSASLSSQPTLASSKGSSSISSGQPSTNQASEQQLLSLQPAGPMKLGCSNNNNNNQTQQPANQQQQSDYALPFPPKWV